MKIVRKSPDGWRFVHALIRDAALQSFLPSELRQRHRALAEWYEANERGRKRMRSSLGTGQRPMNRPDESITWKPPQPTRYRRAPKRRRPLS